MAKAITPKEQFNLHQLVESMKQFNVAETLKLLQHSGAIFWSWGARGFKSHKNQALIFRVSGHHHKGLVIITVNGADLYNVYITKKIDETGNFECLSNDIFTDIYNSNLTETIDNRIERIKAYQV